MTDDHADRIRRQPPPGSTSWPLVTPIWPSVVWCTDDPDGLDAIYDGAAEGFVYGREGHPNWSRLAALLDGMEGATGGTVFSSGMGAVGAVLLAVLKAGDHVVASSQLYGRSLRLLARELPRLGIETSFVDPGDGAAWERAMRPQTRLALVEVIANPTIRVADMEALIAAARARGVPVAVDNTFTTPALYRPLAAGADIVIHSVTKLLGGHSDATLGYAAARDPEIGRRIYEMAASWGTTPSPFDCWLAERGLMSFSLRLERAEANASRLAAQLAASPAVEAVFHPARADHPDHNRARALLGGRGGHMLSFRLRGGRAAVTRFLHAASDLPFAPTLGDVATTLSHPASSSHRELSEEARLALGITQGFVRVSVGIDEPAGLEARFAAGLAAAGTEPE